MNPRLLTSCLKDAASLADLEQLEKQYGDTFDFIHISAAFSRSGHLASSAAAQSNSFRPLLHRLWRRLQPQLDACGEQALASIVWACGKAGYAEAALLDACLARLVDKAADAAPQALANPVYSAVLLQEHGYKISEQQGLQLVAALVQKRQDATPQHLANTFWAAATMGLQLPEQQAQQLVAALVQKQQDAKPKHLANTALALAKLGLHDAQLFSALTAAAKPKLAAHLQQPYQVHLWLLDVQTGSNGLAAALSSAQLQQCKEAWEEQLQQRAQKRRSLLEQEVYQCCAQQLHSLLIDCRQEARTEDGAFSIDVVATHTASGKRLAIEADGPTHFLRPGRQVTGDTLARNRVLAAHGYVVVSVPYWEWAELKKSEQADYLARKVEAALEGGAGHRKARA